MVFLAVQGKWSKMGDGNQLLRSSRELGIYHVGVEFPGILYMVQSYGRWPTIRRVGMSSRGNEHGHCRGKGLSLQGRAFEMGRHSCIAVIHRYQRSNSLPRELRVLHGNAT